MLSAGSTVDGYRIERTLGEGGMGTVYLAANPTLPRHDALKVLSAELSRDPDFRSRFLREADVAAALDHPNIVSVYNRGQTADGQLWIAMQFVDGTDADAALRAGTMTPERAVHIITEVGKALDHAHRHNVVHRDVKPANFLLSGPPGPDERVLLGDFGIARALDDVGLTVTGSVMATVAYAAPEVLSGQPFDGRADLYSLGCTLFRLVTGKTPFSSANGMAAVMMAHLQAPPLRVTDFMPMLPAAMDAVIATAMAKNPAHRFASAGQLATAAADALTNGAASATIRWQPVPSSEVNSYPQAPGGQPPWWQYDHPRTMAATPAVAPTRARRRGWLIGAIAAVVLLVAGSVTAVMLTSGDSSTPAADATSTSSASPPTDAPSASVAASAPAELATQPPPPAEASDTMQARNAVLAFQDAYNNQDWDAYLAVMCPSMRASFENPAVMDELKRTRANNGLTKVTIQTIAVEGDTATAFLVSEVVGTGKKASVTMPLVRDNGWKICMNY